MEAYLRETHSEANRDRPLGDCSRISEVEPQSKILDTKEPKWKEVLKVVKKA